MALYLIDKRYGKFALDIAKKDKSAKIVLLQDGVYLDIVSILGKREIFYIEDDTNTRGIDPLPEGVNILVPFFGRITEAPAAWLGK